ncbi:MAG: hypothetical protein HYS13_01455 [Planctomycetia bacterium]|nr:hypothetical protein [Planctomycetia bacterium]
MMFRFASCLLPALLAPALAPAEDAKSAKITVTVRGITSAEDAQAVRDALKAVEKIKFNADDVQPGEKGKRGHYFSPPFVIELSDTETTDIGAVAKAVSEAKTAKRDDLPPSLNLAPFLPGLQIQETDVSGLRAAMDGVSGVDALAAGGVGGVPGEGRLWVRLSGEGQARLTEILTAAAKVELGLKLEKQ